MLNIVTDTSYKSNDILCLVSNTRKPPATFLLRGNIDMSQAPERLTTNDNIRFPRLTKELVDEANKELDVRCRNRETGAEMMKLLPPLSQACQMCETFLEYGRYVYV